MIRQNRCNLWALVFWVFLGSLRASVATAEAGKIELWYTQPAKEWVEALPLGNGRLGAMVFGGTQSERLQLNEVSIWSGSPNRDADRADAYKVLPELRKMLREGKYAEAEKFANTKWNGPAPYDASYQTLGDLTFDFTLPAGDVEDYRRDLSLSNAVAGVSFRIGPTRFTRQTFSSAADQVLVHRITASAPASVSFTVALSRKQRATTRADADELIMTGDTGPTLKFEARARVIAKGGKVSDAGDGRLRVEGADEAIVLLSAATNYALDYDAGYVGGDVGRAKTLLDAASGKSFDQLLAAHVKEYHSFFNRMSIDLGGDPEVTKLPTDQRLLSYNTNHDPSMVSLFFQYGRYLLISCSRPGNVLPANLQGIWGDGFTLPWKSDYHTNINIQMIYWPALPANLFETHLPLVHFTQSLEKPGAKTAKAYFGPDSPGWVLSYTSNAWGWTSFGKRLSWGLWTGGSGWMCRHLWEHYAFSQDKAYLKSAYPTMKSACEFWLANLVESPSGTLIVSPSSSPEHGMTTDEGVTSLLTEGAAMEREIVWDLLDNTASAAAVLGVDDEFAKKLTATRDRIEPLRIGKLGQLMEWNGDWDANNKDPHHRHVSHLYALHPGHQIRFSSTPDLIAAARKSLELRGDDGTGWSLAWKINFWARLRDGERALKLIGMQLRATKQAKTVMSNAGGTYPNLFDAHPPFQLDGNMGFVAGVAELMVQSHEKYVEPASPGKEAYFVDLLPSLPKSWSSGSVQGLRARGGLELDLSWRDGTLVSVTVRSSVDHAKATLRYGELRQPIDLQSGQAVTFGPQLLKAK